MDALKKALSRKFLVTLTALVALFETSHLDTTSKIIVAVVASVYVIAETVLDRNGQTKFVTNVANNIQQGIALAREVSGKALADSGAPVSPMSSASPPAATSTAAPPDTLASSSD